MKRREVIRDLFLATGGFVLAFSCRQENRKGSISLQHFSITATQEQLLKNIASAIIPTTDTPGAGDLGCHLFVLKMLDDCYEKETQEKFIKGMDALDGYSKKKFNDSFVQCNQQTQQQILNETEKGNAGSTVLAEFYVIMKERTVEGYMTSKYVMTNINKYELIPSVRYNGYAPVKF